MISQTQKWMKLTPQQTLDKCLSVQFLGNRSHNRKTLRFGWRIDSRATQTMVRRSTRTRMSISTVLRSRSIESTLWRVLSTWKQMRAGTWLTTKATALLTPTRAKTSTASKRQRGRQQCLEYLVQRSSETLTSIQWWTWLKSIRASQICRSKSSCTRRTARGSIPRRCKVSFRRKWLKKRCL